MCNSGLSIDYNSRRIWRRGKSMMTEGIRNIVEGVKVTLTKGRIRVSNGEVGYSESLK